MQHSSCAACQSQVPKGQSFDVAGRTLCRSCLEKLLGENPQHVKPESITRHADPTVCVHCSADGGATEWPMLLGMPTCDACNHLFHHRPFPRWLKISAAVFLCVAIVAFVHNWRFFSAYVGYLRGLRALEREQFEQGLALLDAAARRVPEIPDLAVLPNLLNAQLLVAEDKNEEAIQLLNKTAAHVPDDLRPTFENVRLSAQMGLAFNAGDYDAFLEAAQKFAQNSPEDPTAVGSVASAFACKYASTGDPEYQAKCLQELERARALAGPNDEMFKEYENRIRHRIDSKEIISREEYVRRFPDGYKPEASP